MNPKEAEILCREAADLVAGGGDAAKAAEMFRSVADAGYVEGMFGLAELTFSGRGVPRDERSAIALYGRAADAGSVPAAFRLGDIFMSEGEYADPERARRYFQMCCDADFEPAYGRMGDLLFRGTKGDCRAAAAWYDRAASAGDPVSMFKLGCMYEAGTGVGADPGRAYGMFRRSAESGFPEAQFKMATLSYDGLVEGGKSAALEWYSRCSGSIPVAKFNAATMLLHGDGVPEDKGRAFAMYRELAESGDSDAMFQIGRMYIEGEGVDQDPEEGFRRVGEAARMGNPEAAQLVENLRRRQNAQFVRIDGAEE